MRDPARIDRILALVKKRWQQNPDQRFGQLLLNLLPSFCDEAKMWHAEDEDTEVALQVPGWPSHEKSKPTGQ